MDSTLKYVDEADKAYGLAGMATAIYAWDAEESLQSIDLNAEPEEAMHMAANYYLQYAPCVGAKAVWSQNLKRFHLTAAMTVANVACREIVHRSKPGITSATDAALREFLTDEGRMICGLDDDEVMSIYNKSLAYCRRLFSHPGVRGLVADLAHSLQEQRRMTASDVFEILAPLGRM